jgi:hypothetical protein
MMALVVVPGTLESCRNGRSHQQHVHPGAVDEVELSQPSLDTEAHGLVGANRPRVVSEYDQPDTVQIEMPSAIIERHGQHFRAASPRHELVMF